MSAVKWEVSVKRSLNSGETINIAGPAKKCQSYGPKQWRYMFLSQFHEEWESWDIGMISDENSAT